jgi:AcrR family transcriptional regulator
VSRIATDRSREILSAARELLLTVGYAKTTIDDIAQRARIGKGSIYLYWPNKVRLFGAILLLEIADSLEYLSQKIQDDPENARLSRIVRHMLESVHDRPLTRAIFGEDPRVFDVMEQMLVNGPHLGGLRDTLERVVPVLRDADLVTRAPASEITLAVEAVVRGFIVLLERDQIPLHLDDVHQYGAVAEHVVAASYETPVQDPSALATAAPAIVHRLREVQDIVRASAAPTPRPSPGSRGQTTPPVR